MIQNIKNKWNSLDKYTKYSIILITIGILLRFYLAFNATVAGDSCWHLGASRFIAENSKIPLFDNIGRNIFWHPPLFHILTASIYLIFSIFMTSVPIWALNLVSPIFGALYLIVSYKIATLLFNKKTAFYVIVFLAFLPNLVFHSSISYADITISALALLAIYLFLKQRIYLGSVVLGLALLSKYNALIIIPVLIYILYLQCQKINKQFTLKVSLMFLVSFIVSGFWYIRNWVYLGNPIWHFGNEIFKGIPIPHLESRLALSNLLNPYHFVDFFLSLFGVPNGLVSNFSFLPFKYPLPLIIIWATGMLLFLLPVFIGLFKIDYKQKRNRIIIFLLIMFMLEHIVLIIERGNFQSRRMMPAFLSLAILWAIGYHYILSKVNVVRIKKAFVIMLCLILIGMVSGEVLKNKISRDLWDSYQPDFDWIKNNTDSTEWVLSSPSQCIGFHINRITFHDYTKTNGTILYNITKEFIIENNVSYAYVTTNNTLIPDFSLKNIDLYEEILASEIVYTNNKDTTIYKLS